VSVAEHEHEPVRGLPDYLPDDEHLVWRGEPDFKVMALRVFHLRTVGIYFAALIAIHLGVQAYQGADAASLVLQASWMVGLGLVTIGILALLAWAYTRSTVYTLTNKRLVLRFGVAIPMMVNLPLPIVGAADLRRYGDGSGDIMFTLGQKKKLSYLLLWPNIKPWQFKPVVPAMRCLRSVDEAAAAIASVVDGGAADQDAQISVRGPGKRSETRATRAGELVGAA
jgi:hypothetical protein